MIVSAFFVPHCPAAIPEIGKEQQFRIPQTIQCYQRILQVFQEKGVQSLLVVSGQTVPFIKEFAIHEGERLEGDFSAFDLNETTTIENNIDMVQRIASLSFRDHIPLRGMTEVLDFGQALPLYFFLKVHLNLPTTAIHISHESMKLHKDFGKVISEASLESEVRIGLIVSSDLSNKVSKTESKEYELEAHTWNKEFLKILQGNLIKLSTLDLFVTEDVAGLYPLRAAKILEGILSKYLYKAKNSFYEEAFGIGYGGVEWEIME